MTTELHNKNSIAQFFFAREVPYGMALARIILPLVLLLDMGPRWFHAREFYSSDGAAAPLAINYGHYNFLPTPDGTVAVGLATVLVFSLVCASIGWCGRLALVLSAVTYTYLIWMDCLSTMTKYTVIASHTLFLLSLSRCDTVWSVDNWLRTRSLRKKGILLPGETGHRQFPAWPRRLLQFLIGIVYFGAAFTKMHTPAYFSSDQMRQWMLTNVNQSNPIGEYLSFYPETLVISAYVAIVWEVLFVFLSWRGWGRVFMIGLGITFHAATFILLGLDIFPLVCFSTYLAFVNESDIQRLGALARRLIRRSAGLKRSLSAVNSRLTMLIPAVSPRAALTAFSATLCVVLAGGIALEYQLDPFAIRQAEGALSLKEIPDEQVRRLFTQTERLRESDKFLTFEIGTELLGDVLVQRKNVFRHGEQLVAQCVLNPPHEDMYVECNLHDAEGRIIERVGQIIDRSTLRANWAYVVTEALEPGTWFLVVHSGGKPVMKRPFTVLPRE